MSVAVEIIKSQHVAIVTINTPTTAQDLDKTVREILTPFVHRQKPHHAHIIFDVSAYEIDIVEFIKYINLTVKRRKSRDLPRNFSQYVVGRGRWLQRFQSWMGKVYGEALTICDTLDEALEHTKRQYAQV